jgi:hypothetical protein
MCFEVEGTVVDYFLKSDAKYGHYITLRLSPEDILSIKNIVRGAPNYSEENFQWPIDNNVAKFKSNPEQPDAQFSPILDARKINDFKNHNGYLEALPLDDLRKDSRVSVEYTWHPIKEETNLSQVVLLIYIRLLRSKWKDRFYTTTPPVPVKEPDFTSHSTYTL